MHVGVEDDVNLPVLIADDDGSPERIIDLIQFSSCDSIEKGVFFRSICIARTYKILFTCDKFSNGFV